MSLPARQHYVTFKTKAGWIGLLGSRQGLVRTTLPQKTREMAVLDLGNPDADEEQIEDQFQDLARKLVRYFEGQKIIFNEQLDLSRATAFERAVWQTTREISYGRTESYAWVARQINRPQASRAVGQALGRNPLPIIIPCHRVIASDGQLRGFGGGLDMKQYLLDLETKNNS